MKNKNCRENLWISISVVLFFICLLLSVALGFLYVKKITPQKFLSKVGIKVTDATDYSLMSWNSSLEQLVYDADVVFIGDSLTRGENFQEYFPDYKIINLGLSGDTVNGIFERSHIIRRFTPEKIFIMGGVNSLKDNGVEEVISQYEAMMVELKTENPHADIYVQSVLPILNNNEEGRLTNNNIRGLNEKLKDMSDRLGITYIDVHSVYELNGEMNPEYTKDGVHLKEEYKHLWLDLLSEYVK